MKTIAGLRAKVKARGEGGFSLVELLVVVLIIGVLMAIAIPTFLGNRGKAQARDPQSALTNSLTGARGYVADAGDYGGMALTSFNEPAYSYVAGTTVLTDANKKTAAGKRVVAVTFVSANVIRMWAKGDNGNCYVIEDTLSTGSTTYGNHTGDCIANEGAVTLAKWNL